MRLITVTLIGLLMFVLSAVAEKPLGPSLELSPQDVVSIQLKALSEAENDPQTDSGVRRVWAFAHPTNRALTGPLERFQQMLQSPSYRALIGHRAHHMKQISLTPEAAHFAIKITSRDGTMFGYSWHLGKVDAGDYRGMWMTTGVALIGRLGQSL